MSKYVELAKKLNALASDGVAGEKYNAQKALDKLIAKHGITAAQLEQETLEWRRFKCHSKYRQLFYQVAMSVIGNRGGVYRTHPKKRNILFLEVSIIEQVEIQSRFDFYFRAYRSEEQSLLRAFVMKHSLYNIDSKGKTMDELSMEELAAIAKAANLANGMENHNYHKALPEN